MRKHMIGLGAAVGLATLSNAAQATTSVTSNFQVKLQITSQCLAATTSDLDFGTNGFLTTDLLQQMDMTVSCTSTTPYDVGLSLGLNAVGTQRKMLGPNSDVINYSLWSDSNRTVTWGDTIGTDTVHDTGNGQAKTHRVYGKVPAQNTPRPGNYSDTITVTVTY